MFKYEKYKIPHEYSILRKVNTQYILDGQRGEWTDRQTDRRMDGGGFYLAICLKLGRKGLAFSRAT